MILKDAAVLILKICAKKITNIYSRQGTASKMFRDGGANSISKAMLISHFQLHIIPKVSKTCGIVAKTLKKKS
jgi:hypothetical protein